MTLNPHFTWFGEQFNTREISFPSYKNRSPSSRWRLVEKLGDEKYTQLDERMAKDNNAPSEAWAAYLCYNMDDSSKKAVIKIRMQIPYQRSESNPSSSRARQALREPSPYVHREIKALDLLADGGCVSSPVLLGYTQQEQEDNDVWIPRGYIVYILMTWCPGVVLLDFWRRDLVERQEIRDAFRTAYEDCRRCQVVHRYPGWDNLIWDQQAKKCYIIGFRFWGKPTPRDEWRDGVLLAWDLAQEGDSGLEL